MKVSLHDFLVLPLGGAFSILLFSLVAYLLKFRDEQLFTEATKPRVFRGKGHIWTISAILSFIFSALALRSSGQSRDLSLMWVLLLGGTIFSFYLFIKFLREKSDFLRQIWPSSAARLREQMAINIYNSEEAWGGSLFKIAIGILFWTLIPGKIGVS